MKTTLIVTALLATAIASPANAGDFWFKPDGSGLTPGAAKIMSRPPPAVGTVPFRNLKTDPARRVTTWTSQTSWTSY